MNTVASLHFQSEIPSRRVVFLDRDGILNVDTGYVFQVEAFQWVEGIFEVLLEIQNRGYGLIVVTNQSGIGRGYYSEEAFHELSRWMVTELEKKNIYLAALYYCPHLPEAGCGCRKPRPGMLVQAGLDFNLDLTCCWMIGDKPWDCEAAHSAQINQTILVSNDVPNHSGALYTVSSVKEIAGLI